jgi:two-component system response regulator AtoC
MSTGQSASHDGSGAGSVDAARILVVDDESLFAKAVRERLRRSGMHAEIAETLSAARRQLTKFRPDLVLLDMRLPDGSGLDLLAEIRAGETPDLPVVVLTAFGDLDDAVAVMKQRAMDYLKKPVDLDELVITLEKVLEKVALSRQLEYSRQRERRAIVLAPLLGESEPMRRVHQQLEQICRLASHADGMPPNVLIVGETGTGKDLAARTLHSQSARAERPFVHVDCAALPANLIEAELFGHVRGAFTGAHNARTGLIEAAENGTLFLDEVAELPLELQAKLLAVLERRAVRRVGSSRERSVAAWLIAASNRDLDDMVKSGDFRSDLYYRMKVLTLPLPPLRERGDDILLLVRHFASAIARRYGLGEARFAKDAVQALVAYRWPGNVRELMHSVERAILLSGGEPVTAATLNLLPPGAEPEHDLDEALREMTLEEIEAAAIEAALRRAGGNVSEAARRLGVSRMVIRYRMQKRGIDASRN